MPPGGRSSGCRTCRMRHLKCDEGKPTCARCKKAKIECRGYDVLEVFVDERSKTMHRSGHRVPPKSKAASAPPMITWEENSSTFSFSEQSPKSPTEEIPRPLLPPAGPSRPLLAPREEIYVTFLVDRLSGSGWGKNTHASIVEKAWYQAILYRDSTPSTLDYASSALAAALYGKLQFQPPVTALAMSRYGVALKMLKDDLMLGQWAKTDTLATAMCLILFETVIFTNPDGWRGHAEGVARLIEARGPASFQDPQSQAMLRGNRLPITLAAMIDRKPCFLDAEEWATVPWAKGPSSKNFGDTIFDIFSTVPRLISDVEVLEDAPNKDGTQLSNEILSHLQKLYRWRWQWEGAHQCVAFETSSTVEPQSLFATQLHFADVTYAHLIGFYNSILIIYIQLLKRIRGPEIDLQATLPETLTIPAKTNPMGIPGIDPIDPWAAAREICQVIKFRLEQVVTSAVAFGLFVPARMAWAILRDSPAEGEWITRVGYVLGQRSGLEFSKLALSSRKFPERNIAFREAIVGKGVNDPIYAGREEAMQRYRHIADRANSIS